ncbi:MAG: type II toxin-antitoxin system YafQ family toxin [Pseudomonadota bacterium]
MKQIVQTHRFKRDLKLMLKRRYQMSKLDQMISYLITDTITDTPLPERYKPHKLSGNYMGFWECHITPDWLLIYRVHNGDLDLARTGTHSDLFR